MMISVLLDETQQRHPSSHIMVLHWFHTMVTVALLLLLPWQVYSQEGQTERVMDTGRSNGDIMVTPINQIYN